MAPSPEDSIAAHGLTCSSLFKNCIEASASFECTPSLQSQSKRYELWAKNIAAHHNAKLPSSLEYRIGDDENARRILKKALTYLVESLEILLSIFRGEKKNEKWDLSSEIEELVLAIEEGTTNLFELSMIIRRKPEKDEYLIASLANTFDPTPDIVHVGDKYPLTRSEGRSWLKERLGTAITRRRQFLRYRKDHQEKMEEIHEMKKSADGKTMWSGEKASTYHKQNFGNTNQNAPNAVNLTPVAAGNRPQTEYADSSRGMDGEAALLRTPLLPRDSDGVRIGYGQHFECPYCRRPQNVRDKNEWKKHVFSDLRPYVCTFEGCELNMFESQHQWFDHEVRFHRKLWLCTFCTDVAPSSRPELAEHLRITHMDSVQGQNIEILLDSCAIVRIAATCCPMCTAFGDKLQKINQSGKCDVSLKQFQEHLGRHMEQLALAALPEEDRDEEGEEEEEEEGEEEEEEVYGVSGHAGDSENNFLEGFRESGTFRELSDRTSSPPPQDPLRNIAIKGTKVHEFGGKYVDLPAPQKKKRGVIDRLFSRRQNDGFDQSDFEYGPAQPFPEVPGERLRNRSLGELRDFYDREEAPTKTRKINLTPSLLGSSSDFELARNPITQGAAPVDSYDPPSDNTSYGAEESSSGRSRRAFDFESIFKRNQDVSSVAPDAGSTHSARSNASTVLSHASNIIHIDYIPGVTNRSDMDNPTRLGSARGESTSPTNERDSSIPPSTGRDKALPPLPPTK